MAGLHLSRGFYPYLFAYDVSDNRRRGQLLKVLKRWRVDGQYSVHETMLRPSQVNALCSELVDLTEHHDDLLMMTRLSQKTKASVFHWQQPTRPRPILGGPKTVSFPHNFSSGSYLLAYDVRNPKRLGRVQRQIIKRTLFIQKSVYLFQGKGSELKDLVILVTGTLEKEDDFRIYPVASLQNMWFLSGNKPPLPGLNSTKNAGFLKTLRRWVGK